MLLDRLLKVWQQPDFYRAPEPVSDDEGINLFANVPKAEAIDFLKHHHQNNDPQAQSQPAVKLSDRLTARLIEQETIDPMIGMQNVTPNDD